MGSAVPAALLRPATALVGRLRYAQKFAVVGVVLLLPLGLIAGAYVQSQREQIAFSAKERQGVALMAPLDTLAAQAAQARHVAAAGPVAVPRADKRRLADPAQVPADDLDAAIGAVDAQMRRYGTLLHSANDWRSVRALLESARRGGYRDFNPAIDALLNLIVHVGDESNLTLDPDLDTYYLMDTLQFRLPVLLDTAGRGVDRAVADRSGDGNGVLIELGLDNGVLTSTRNVISRAVGTIERSTTDAHVRQETGTRFAALDGSLDALGRVLTAAVQNRRAGAVPVDAADAVRTAAAAFAAWAAPALDGLLRARIGRFTGRADRIELIAGVSALLGGYLFVGFYLGVVPPIRRIVDGLRAVADGDLTRVVCVDTRDELSFVVRTLNDTVARTRVATERLALAATHDPLTALPNRSLVLDRLDQALHRAQRSGRRMAVFFIDLDQFKMVNDSCGHEAGDQVLRTVAGRLTALAREDDTVARLAGDEFVLICENVDSVDAAVRLAERAVAALSQPITLELAIGCRPVTIGASVGVAFADGTGAPCADDLLRDADVAMYRAKQRGRGRVEIFDDALRVSVERRMRIQGELRRAIDEDELVVHYQPIVAAGTGTVHGYEALVRWQHPERGLLAPGEFIDVAEESGLIVPLGAAVLAKACAQLARWRAGSGEDALHVAVNVSAAQFGHPSFVPMVASVLAETGLDPDALWLEITETSIMADASAAEDTLHAIRALGVHLAIDDFGTGYSSLTYLRRFPVEALKVDRSFTDGLGRDKEDEAIVAMIIGLANTLNLTVVAEGVETEVQLDRLRSLGCPVVQGYLLGRPVPAAQARPVAAALTSTA